MPELPHVDLNVDDYAKDKVILDGSVPQMKINTGAREVARVITNPLRQGTSGGGASGSTNNS